MTLSKDSILGMIYERSKRSFIHMGIFSFFINVLMLTIPIYMMQLFDRVLVSHSYQTLIFLTLIAFFAILILSVIDIVRSHVAMKLSSWYDEILSTAALLFSPDQVLKGNSYPMMVLRDIQTLKQFIGSNSLFTFFDAPWTPIYLLVIGAISPLLGIIATIGAVLIFLTAWLNERMTRKMQNASSEMATANIYTTTNNLKHAEVIQAMGMLKSLISQWQNQNKDMMSLHEKNGQLSGMFLGISKFLRLAFQILILGIGSYLVLDNSITSGMMIASSILMSRALAPVEQAMGVWRQFQQVKLILYRLQEHFNFSADRNTDLMLPKPKGHLTLENLYLTTSKSENKFIIQNISLRIKAGEMVAFIGSSAAGKSTLMRLICGVTKPSGGLVRLDEADIYHWNRDDVGHYLGYLPQDIELFLGSVKENIARMGAVDDEAVIEAASLAECHDMILHLPEGYNTIIKPGSPQISGGQRQRIALARALYGNPSLVVLDEPNSNLDGEGEEALARTLQKLKKRGVTVLIVAHRFNVIQFVDTIVVLQQGKIQSAGPRDQILEALQRKAT